MLRENLKPATARTPEVLGSQIGVPILLTATSFLSRFQTRERLFVHELGFRIQKGSKEINILYSEIESIKVRSIPVFSAGIQYATRYDIEMIVDEKTISIRNLSPEDRNEPFATFVKRMITLLADDFSTKKKLHGNDWVLDEEGFRGPNGNLMWNEIGYVDVIDRHVCIWKSLDTYPAFRIEESSTQALILNELLERYTRNHPQKLLPDSLGRFLFLRKVNKTLIKFIGVIAALLLLAGIGLLLMTPPAVLPAFLLLFLSGPTALYAVFSLRRTFHFFQNGIIQEPGHRVLFYHRCDSMTYQENLQFINGIYAFTRIQMNLQGVTGSMKIKTQGYGNDPEIEQARVEAGMKICDRLHQKMATQGEVSWGKWGRIAQHEVRYLSSRILGSNTGVTLPFTQPISYSIDSGKFYLFRAGESIPLFEMDCSEENFYPGFFLLLKLVAEH